jgi:hypothetical protein
MSVKDSVPRIRKVSMSVNQTEVVTLRRPVPLEESVMKQVKPVWLYPPLLRFPKQIVSRRDPAMKKVSAVKV